MINKDLYIIFGAQMANKGAQAMLFITVSEIRRRDPNAKIIVFFYDSWKSKENQNIYNMDFVSINMNQIMNLSRTLLSKAYILLKKSNISKSNKNLLQIDYILKHSKMAFDISGYALSNQWGIKGSLFYLSKFAMLNKYNIPIYIMPQSFGPFDYGSKIKNIFMKYYIKKYLSYAEKIFAREIEGYNYLTKEVNLKNVELSNDLVLQNSVIFLDSIYKKIPKFKEIKVKLKNNVAIIPNSSNNKYGDKSLILKLYKDIIIKLQNFKKNIYLLSHSTQDLELCNEILEHLENKNNVNIIDIDLNCIEYTNVIKKFDYIIASRFHSIVNAFKVGIPCISLGWASKYKELLNLFSQCKFHFDVREPNKFKNILDILDIMNQEYSKQSKIISEKLKKIQENSCFIFLDDVIGKDLKIKKNVQNFVSKDNLCTGCGICKAICPKECITYIKDNGIYKPNVEIDKCTNCKICLENCPGLGYDYEKKWNNSIPDNKLIGNYISLYTAYSKSKEQLKKSTSGGCITSIIKRLLSENLYDVAFVVKNHNFNKQIFSQKISNISELTGTEKSRYIPIAHTEAIKFALKNPEKKIIFVGTSCFVHGLLNVIENFKLNRENYLILGLFCDRTLNYNIWNYFSEKFCKNNLNNLYFRDKENSGWPGNVTCVNCDGSRLDLSSKTRTNVKDYFQLESCLYCLDKLNQFADISFGDNYSDKEYSKSVNGANSVIVRSDLGLKIINICKNDIEVKEENVDNIINSQNINLRYNNYTFLKLKLPIYNKNTGFFETNIEKEAVKNYDSKLIKIKIGEQNNLKNLNKELMKNKKYKYINKLKKLLKN